MKLSIKLLVSSEKSSFWFFCRVVRISLIILMKSSGRCWENVWDRYLEQMKLIFGLPFYCIIGLKKVLRKDDLKSSLINGLVLLKCNSSHFTKYYAECYKIALVKLPNPGYLSSIKSSSFSEILFMNSCMIFAITVTSKIKWTGCLVTTWSETIRT